MVINVIKPYLLYLQWITMSNSKSLPPILKPYQLPFQKCKTLGVICWNDGGTLDYVKVVRISTLSHNLDILRGSECSCSNYIDMEQVWFEFQYFVYLGRFSIRG